MILFVDDEARRVESYQEACEDAKMEVRVLSNVDKAWRFIEKESSQIELVVLDVMMPTGDRYEGSPAALGGIRTGLSFYRDLRNSHPELPIMILTQSNDGEIDKTVGHDRWTALHRKQSVLPTELPELIRKQLQAKGAA